MYYLYILECSDQSLYCGITVDLNKRVVEHNSSPKAARYTRSRRPVKLVFSKKFENRSDASKEESRIKKLTRAQKINFLETVGEN